MASSLILPDQQTIHRMVSRYPEIDVPSVEACLAFLDTSTAFYNAVDNYLAHYRLSRGKFTLLMQLVEADENGLLPSEFAERAGVTRASVTSLLDGLERDKLIVRQPHPIDRRMLTIHMTDKGRELMNTILPQHFVWIKEWMENLSHREQQTLIELLAKLRSGIDLSEKL
ncbi:MarR family winged helix-turn-helix transcriptional regulator [Scytonema sp. NUACC26]|uniref:MarR family winged helix-turn-helix transcriptional regulator n=1 Tax=Scytonema sp. NUACC26 TaxID=3140176 RepID=UPI0034DB86D8